jgi:hypothetical protein
MWTMNPLWHGLKVEVVACLFCVYYLSDLRWRHLPPFCFHHSTKGLCDYVQQCIIMMKCNTWDELGCSFVWLPNLLNVWIWWWVLCDFIDFWWYRMSFAIDAFGDYCGARLTFLNGFWCNSSPSLSLLKDFKKKLTKLMCRIFLMSYPKENVLKNDFEVFNWFLYCTNNLGLFVEMYGSRSKFKAIGKW